MEEMIKELNEYVRKIGETEFGIKSEEIKAETILKRVKNTDEGNSTTAFIYISDNGTSVDGATPDIMNLLSLLIRSLVKHGMEKELIKKSIEIGFATEEEKTEMLKNCLEKLLKEMENK